MKTLITPDHIAFQVRSSGWGRTGIGWSSGKALTWNSTRRLWFVVYAAGLLHSMVLHGHSRPMLMLRLNEAIDQLAMSSSVYWYGHVLRREDGHALRRVVASNVASQFPYNQ